MLRLRGRIGFANRVSGDSLSLCRFRTINEKYSMVAIVIAVYSTHSHSQSTATLYGIVDAGITVTQTQPGLDNMPLQAGSGFVSRWGAERRGGYGWWSFVIFYLDVGFSITT
ncbi:hypothetical protein PUN4_990009 [Paraburkholderia unamae]|nr:hypothetical protein PUN4_990009 [Paraburkholderia unamae]